MRNFVAAFFRLAILMLFPAVAFSLPQGEQVVHGEAVFTPGEGGALEVSVSDKAIINYDSFNIAELERVRFVQPGSQSCVLNRVVGGDPSSILGSLESNGRVFLVNPNGIYFGPAATVNVGSLVASTLNIKDQDFLQDKFQFHMDKDAASSFIHNLGHISSPEGAVVFLAPHIKNEGVVAARAGSVFFGAAESVTLDFAGDGMVSFLLEGELEQAVIEHLGSATADDIFMKMKVAKKAIQQVVNTDGVIEGNTIVQENGIIKIVNASTLKGKNVSIEGSEGTTVTVSGTIDASDYTTGGTGGTVEVLGDHIRLLGANIDASGDLSGGSVFVGGDYKGLGDRKTAATNRVDVNSTIKADAINQGDGGTVIVWSDDVTYFDGTISVLGGQLSGNGGFVETSGKMGLGIRQGRVLASAPKGRSGDWLLDPTTITIDGAGTDSLADAADCGNTATAKTISAATINAATANVILCASVSITQNAGQNINIAGGAYSLTFRAATAAAITATLNGTITTSNAAVVFDNTTGLVNVSLAGDSTITTGGGAITFQGTINGAQALTLNASGGAVTMNGIVGGSTPIGNLAITAGTVAFNAATTLAATKTLTVTNSGTCTIASGANITAPGGFSTTGNVSLAANVTTTNTTLSIGGTLTIAEAA
ncbi:MAG: filamentous hemagglutinin N-terminal domain-containing protein, partial [Chlamydiae bacterium]|nr:filamentous hemagglutinin N-terminal domain-containing protein [Chlamydiota bacterium]